MTDRPTNRLIGNGLGRGAPAFIEVQGHVVPTDIVEYCAWLNSREKRDGKWLVIGDAPNREVTFSQSPGSAEWRAERSANGPRAIGHIANRMRDAA